MFEEEYLKLTKQEQESFAVTINHLLTHSFIVRDSFDNKEKIFKINPLYRFCERRFDLINEYLYIIGYQIDKDIILGVISLSNVYTENRIKIDRETSLLLYVLRLIYESEKNESAQTTAAVYITTPTLIKTMLEFSVPYQGKRLSGRSLAKSLRLLANRNIISKISGSYDEGNVTFYILPSIMYAIDNNKIQAMAEAIEKINLETRKVDLSKFEGGEN